MFFFKDIENLNKSVKEIEREISRKKESSGKLSDKEKETVETEIKALEEEIARKKALLLRRKIML